MKHHIKANNHNTSNTVRVGVACTVVSWVLVDSDVKEGGVKPVQCYADVSDGVQHYLGIEVLYQVVV